MKKTSLLALVAVSVALFAQGCSSSSESAGSTDSASDISTASTDHATVLADALSKANAPSNEAPTMVGVSSHIARITLTSVAGGMAKNIGESGTLSTVDGDALGDLVDLGIAWTPLHDALVAGGAKTTSVPGLDDASSTKIVASVECKQAISPTAKPSCSVTPITLTADDNSALKTSLANGQAPSVALAGADAPTAVLTLTITQGGTAHFISQDAELTTLDGQQLADVTTIGVAWQALETALLDAGGSWQKTDGADGSSSSTLAATVSCEGASTCNVSVQ